MVVRISVRAHIRMPPPPRAQEVIISLALDVVVGFSRSSDVRCRQVRPRAMRLCILCVGAAMRLVRFMYGRPFDMCKPECVQHAMFVLGNLASVEGNGDLILRRGCVKPIISFAFPGDLNVQVRGRALGDMRFPYAARMAVCIPVCGLVHIIIRAT